MANSASSKRTGLRKLPTQARSRERVADILKATGALLGEVGYDGLSTNLIAERAKVPVGSIYQFFETKDDIVAALVEQFQDRILRLANEKLDAAGAARDRRAFIARLVEGIAGIQAASRNSQLAGHARHRCNAMVRRECDPHIRQPNLVSEEIEEVGQSIR